MTIAVERCVVSRDLTEPRLSPENQLDEYRRMQAFLATNVRGG